MKLLGSRNFWGGLLILGGVGVLLQNLGLLEFGDLVWSLVFALVGAIFFSIFLQDRQQWWALIPGFTLVSIAALIAANRFFPQMADRWSGAFVLGGIGLSFLVIYLLDRHNWWSIIPAGVLSTLAAITIFEGLPGINTGGVLFLGFGLTFALVALLPTPDGKMNWAWIPAGVFLLMGLLMIGFDERLVNSIWPVALILVGLYMIFRNFSPRKQ